MAIRPKAASGAAALRAVKRTPDRISTGRRDERHTGALEAVRLVGSCEMTVINWVRRTSQVGEAWRTAAAQGRRKGIAQDVEARIALCHGDRDQSCEARRRRLVAINGFPDADRSGIELLVLAKGRAYSALPRRWLLYNREPRHQAWLR
jgi:hypothetical protein